MSQKPLHKHKQIIVILLLSFVSVYLLVYYLPWGGKKYFHLQEDIDLLTSEVATLQQQNKELASEISKLKEDTQYIEEVARKQFGLLKKNEVVFEFKNSTKAHEK